MPDDKTRSLRALDALNFCNAGIQTGLGPFMSIFYTVVRHWNPGEIGILLACQSFVGIAVQTFVGNWVDESKHKRLLTAVAGIVVALSAIGIVALPSFALQVVVQLVIGFAVTIFPASTAAFALGMVEQGQITQRIARNESFTHTGNLIFAITAGIVGTTLALGGIFYGAAVFAAGMALSVFFIQDDHISHEAARAAAAESDSQPRGMKDLFKDKRILVFAAAIVLFYFANAATLPLVGELLSKSHQGRTNSAWQISAAVIVAEGVMIGVAAYSGKVADRWGRKPLFLIAFATLALRNGLSVVNHNEYYLISLQAFDGIAAAIYGVLLNLVTADLARGTGRFNFLKGTVQSAMGLGGFLSNGLFGYIAKVAGFNASFIGLAVVAAAGGLLYQFKMPETRPDDVTEAVTNARER